MISDITLVLQCIEPERERERVNCCSRSLLFWHRDQREKRSAKNNHLLLGNHQQNAIQTQVRYIINGWSTNYWLTNKNQPIMVKSQWDQVPRAVDQPVGTKVNAGAELRHPQRWQTGRWRSPMCWSIWFSASIYLHKHTLTMVYNIDMSDTITRYYIIYIYMCF